MGVSDGTSAASQSVDDILQWYSLKKQSDSRIRGLSFEQFQTKKKQGEFSQTYKVTEDSYLQNLFLQ
jgi:hypothetical protein